MLPKLSSATAKPKMNKISRKGEIFATIGYQTLNSTQRSVVPRIVTSIIASKRGSQCEYLVDHTDREHDPNSYNAKKLSTYLEMKDC